MKSEKIAPYLNKKVIVTLFDDTKLAGILRIGEPFYKGDKKTRYFVDSPESNNIYFLKSHIKRIWEI